MEVGSRCGSFTMRGGDYFFLSGCFDKKIRVWNIRDGRVQEWQQAPDMVTAAKFSLDGKMIVVGLIKGQVIRIFVAKSISNSGPGWLPPPCLD